MPPKVICIDGIIGAGKTTLIKSLNDTYTCFQEPIHQWTLLSNLYSDMKLYAEPFQYQVLFSQYDQYQSFKNVDGLVLIERSSETSLKVFTKLLKDQGLFSDEAYSVYEKFNGLIGCKPDFYIYLDLDVRSAWRRIQDRDRFEEQNITFDYLSDLKAEYDRFFIGHTNCLSVDALQPASQVKADVLKILDLFE